MRKMIIFPLIAFLIILAGAAACAKKSGPPEPSVPANTATRTATPASTGSVVPTSTGSVVPSSTETAVPTGTDTPQVTFTASETVTLTATQTETLISTATDTNTPDPAQTATQTQDVTATVTATATATATNTPLVILFQRGIYPDASYTDTDDTSITNWRQTRTRGSCTDLVTSYSAPYTNRALLRFGVAGLPAGATIAGAYLRLNVGGTAYTGPYNGFVYRITGPWTQRDLCDNDIDAGTNTYPSWTASGFAPWTTAGGEFAEQVGAYSISGTGTFNIQVSASLVQGWLDGTIDDYGVILSPDTAASGSISFYSGESPVPGNRPRLTVYYYAP